MLLRLILRNVSKSSKENFYQSCLKILNKNAWNTINDSQRNKVVSNSVQGVTRMAVIT